MQCRFCFLRASEVPSPKHPRFVFDSPMPLGRLVRQLADKAQVGEGLMWAHCGIIDKHNTLAWKDENVYGTLHVCTLALIRRGRQVSGPTAAGHRDGFTHDQQTVLRFL